MKHKHTPTPWHVGMNPGPFVYGPQGEQVADLRADLLPRDECDANRRLIVAAPELLAALIDLVSPYDGNPDGAPVSVKLARAAIAKATP